MLCPVLPLLLHIGTLPFRSVNHLLTQPKSVLPDNAAQRDTLIGNSSSAIRAAIVMVGFSISVIRTFPAALPSVWGYVPDFSVFRTLSTECRVKHMFSHAGSVAMSWFTVFTFNLRMLYLLHFRARDFQSRCLVQDDFVECLRRDLHACSISEHPQKAAFGSKGGPIAQKV